MAMANESVFLYCQDCIHLITCRADSWACTFDKDGVTCDNFAEISEEGVIWAGGEV